MANKPDSQPTVVPVEMWHLIHSWFYPWETTPLTMLKLSHISKSARVYFTSNKVWKQLNPYQAENPAQHFLETLDSLTSKEKRDLNSVWSHVPTVFKRNNTDQLCYKLLKKEIPSVVDKANTKYYTLGMVVATAVAFWRKDFQKHAITDRGIMLCAVRFIPSTIRRAGKVLANDHELALEAARAMAFLALLENVVQHSEDYFYERKCIDLCFQSVLEAKPQWEDDEEIVFECTVNHPFAWPLRLASPRLQSDEAFIRRVLARKPLAITSTPPDVCRKIAEDQEFMLELAHRERCTLGNNYSRELLLVAFEQTYDPFKDSWVEDREDIEVMPSHEIVKLYFTKCTPAQKIERSNDREVLEVLVAWCGEMLRYASTKLCGDRELVLKAVRNYGCSLKYASTALRKDEEIVRAACASDVLALGESIGYNDNVEFVHDLVKRDGMAYTVASERLRKSHDLLDMALDTEMKAYLSAPLELREKQYFMKKAMIARLPKRSPPLEPKMDINELTMICLQEHTLSLSDVNPSYARDRAVALHAVTHRGSEIYKLPPELQNRPEIYKAALWDCAAALGKIPRTQAVRDDHELALWAKLRGGWFSEEKRRLLWI